MKVSIIIPFYNEKNTLKEIVARVQKALPLHEKEIILIDDGSSDGSSEIAKSISEVTLIIHPKNKGKGAALRSGITKATGEVILFQDADIEYDPNDYQELLSFFETNQVDVVYGSRFIGKKQEHFFLHTYLANKFLSFLTRLLTPLPITDMETCYKAFRSDILKGLTLVEHKFGIEPEITMKMAHIKNIRYKEVPISYTGRSIKQGKKVRWWDGIRAIWCILKYGLFSRGK
ncbi:MAG: glycosyltransferase family 2 protein [Patescibacteria group bacterium]